ncbi:hypothetical protein [uncultured Croceicoccus sp.]|uniref:hypothetical protein n=1 Tax=uncultured Croceicoccus sp. TaxID=1295329 RepID=UPI002628B17F|nr:hypothetical protein [uncultured Croceicoccus sp.]
MLMFQNDNATFEDRTQVLFRQVRVGPAQAMRQCVAAVQRGDRNIVLTSALRTERRTILTEIGRLVGPKYRRVLRFDAALECGHILDRLDLECDDARTETSRYLVIIDNAEMMDATTLRALGDMENLPGGCPLQIVLAGGELLISRMFEPSSSQLWSATKLALTLDGSEPEMRTQIGSADRLRREIARTEAKLATQKRMLAIFEGCGSDGTNSLI